MKYAISLYNIINFVKGKIIKLLYKLFILICSYIKYQNNHMINVYTFNNIIYHIKTLSILCILIYLL